METKLLLGELLVEKKHVPAEIIEEALRLQVGGNRRLGHILVNMKAISSDLLAETLADQLGTPICNIPERFENGSRRTVPRYLCRRYSAMPLAVKANNILEVAMSDPSDMEAISELEHYTGMAVKPCLARHTDINKEIPRCIPLSMRDFFSPGAQSIMTRAVAAVTLICVIFLGSYTYRYIKSTNEGTITITADHLLYHNHDLTLTVKKKGGYILNGHGAYAEGAYAAAFPDRQHISNFFNQHAAEFSETQRNWLRWAIERSGTNKQGDLLTKN